ncbi:MAG TPA: peptidase inhibitor family I36 protein [Candidatus Acidoferrales bacterium]
MFRSLRIALIIFAALLMLPQFGARTQTAAAQGQPYWRDAPPPQWGRGRRPGRGACFYKDANFSNVYFCMSEGQRYSALPRGFNDQISSIRVFGNVYVRIFNDTNFGGMTTATRQSISNLKNLPLAGYPGKHWNDRISAIAVFGSGHDDWGGRGGPGRP